MKDILAYDPVQLDPSNQTHSPRIHLVSISIELNGKGETHKKFGAMYRKWKKLLATSAKSVCNETHETEKCKVVDEVIEKEEEIPNGQNKETSGDSNALDGHINNLKYIPVLYLLIQTTSQMFFAIESWKIVSVTYVKCPDEQTWICIQRNWTHLESIPKRTNPIYRMPCSLICYSFA